MRRNRSRAFWPTRIMLALGVVATVIALALFALSFEPPPGPMFDSRPGILGLPGGAVVALVGLLLSLVGVVWMVRIFRGPRDEPPPWRYRDR